MSIKILYTEYGWGLFEERKLLLFYLRPNRFTPPSYHINLSSTDLNWITTMPFHGVRPERKYLFNPAPVADIGVNDVHAWRLNPQHRYIYNKLHVALSQGLRAAPCGIDPLLLGVAPDANCFIKPITNLGGMSLNTRSLPAQALSTCSINKAENTEENCAAGSFWCEFLTGQQTSSDVLVLDGQPVWYAHTKAANDKNNNRPIYWDIGANCHELEPIIETFIQRELAGYTGLCNIEMIDHAIIEAHLRGSNAFFDYYSNGFIKAWGELVDKHQWNGLGNITQGCLYSLFGHWELPDNAETIVRDMGARLYRDGMMPDRIGIIFADSSNMAEQIAHQLKRMAVG